MLGTSSHILICAGWILLLQGPQAGSLLQFPLHISHLATVKLSSPGAVKPSLAAPKLPAQRGGGIVPPPCSCASCWTNPAFGRKRKRCKGQIWWLEGPGAVLPLLPQVTHLLHYLLALPGTSPNIFSQPCYHAQPRLMNCPVTLCALCIIHHPDTVNVSKIFFPFWRRPHLLLEAFQLFLRERR